MKMTSKCSEYLNSGDGSIPEEPEDFRVENGKGYGGGLELFSYVNQNRQDKG